MNRLVLLFLLPMLRAQDPAAALERAKAVNLERSAKLPSFVADEVAIRYHSKHAEPPKWQQFDKLESEIAVRGSGFIRQNVRRDGKLWKKPDMSDFNFDVQFGEELKI